MMRARDSISTLWANGNWADLCRELFKGGEGYYVCNVFFSIPEVLILKRPSFFPSDSDSESG
jgi:hypothetical protein